MICTVKLPSKEDGSAQLQAANLIKPVMQVRGRAELLVATRILPSQLFSYASTSLPSKQMLSKHAFKGKKRHWIISFSGHYPSQAGKLWDSEREMGPGKNEAEAQT